MEHWERDMFFYLDRFYEREEETKIPLHPFAWMLLARNEKEMHGTVEIPGSYDPVKGRFCRLLDRAVQGMRDALPDRSHLKPVLPQLLNTIGKRVMEA